MPDVDIKSVLTVKDLAAPGRAGNVRVKQLLLTKAELAAEQAALEPIDINHAPLFRAHLFRLDTEDHVLLLVMHDIIIDGWSMAIFMEELSEFYAASIVGGKARLPEPAFQFFDFVRWQRLWSASGAANRQFAYWKGRLRKGLPSIRSPRNTMLEAS